MQKRSLQILIPSASPDVYIVEPSPHGFLGLGSLDSKHCTVIKTLRSASVYVMKLIQYGINVQMIFYFIFLQYISNA